MKMKKMTLLTIIGLICVLGISCGKTGSEKQTVKMSKEVEGEKKAEYKKITSDEAKKMMETEKTIVVDVRTIEEYNEGHIPNAVSIPLDTIENEAEAKRSEEHTSELQSPDNLVCRLLLEKKK